ncbi:Sll0314/Alr1548 family TPR repeat-containing protein [Neosynechococcus sphagnicola]|uniref:Sll0314/Alr1548 family TPR repeat-containing protein n=1 Tax=Neosynechococcus sphagnicola TaxID=1501145 RepID=UPI000907AA61|nr:Sll0314/Alr1548 family TPR repeat-containing protein [Neosynechococcus sphagnicola]
MPLQPSSWKRMVPMVVGTVAIVIGLWTNLAFAKDPFRTSNPHPISANTEAAFRAVFELGNYPEAGRVLQQPDANEPLSYALKAAIAFLSVDTKALRNNDPVALKNLDDFKLNGTQTREVAEKLLATDPLRGNLYLAVGHFLEGAYAITSLGTVAGLPTALSKLELVQKYLGQAEAINRNDPELSLIKGYMDLLLAVNLPFSNPDDAIARLTQYAAPRYLAYRGIAIAYRDLKQFDKALDAVNQTLKDNPNNPEVLYLKAQIFYQQGNYPQALALFDQALTKKDQLPPGVVRTLTRERDKTARKLAQSAPQPSPTPTATPQPSPQ